MSLHATGPAPELALDGHGLVRWVPEQCPPDGLTSVPALVRAAAARFPAGEALVGRHGRLGYADLAGAVGRAAAALGRLGVRPGDRVAASLGNSPEIVVAFLAAMEVGAIWVGVNGALAVPEKCFLLADSGASVLLGDPQTAAAIDDHRSELPELRSVVTVAPEPGAGEWTALLADQTEEQPAPVEPDPFAPAAIAYSSGTTGRPKGAVHSQHNLMVLSSILGRRWADPRRHGICLSLCTLNVMALGPLSVFRSGGCCVTMDRIDAVGIAGWVRAERVEVLAAVPTTLHDLLTHPDVNPGDLATLATVGVGGGQCPDSFRELYRSRFGTEPSVVYGLTEAPAVVTSQGVGGENLPGSSGRPLPHLTVAVVDEDDAACPPGTVGEIVVAAAQAGPYAGVYTPMLGYWNRPDATGHALRGGRLHTGDLGMVDGDGNLFVKGRHSDLILRGGANVYPAEVERVLDAIAGVTGSAVFGIIDERLGERVGAAVELEPDTGLSPEAIREAARAELARYKVPDQVFIVERLPRNAMGKVVKVELTRRLL